MAGKSTWSRKVIIIVIIMMDHQQLEESSNIDITFDHGVESW